MKIITIAILVLMSVFSVKIYAQANADRCLLAYYPFDGNANDTSVYGNDGTVHNATLATGYNGVANSAYHFSGNTGMNGSDVYIEVPNVVDGLENLTISMWVKHDSYTYFQYGEAYISYGTLPAMGNVATSIFFNKNINVISFVIMTDSGTYGCNTPYQPSWVGTFQHFAMVYDGNKHVVKGYHNGSLLATYAGAKGKIHAIGNYAGIGKHWWASGAGESTRINGVFDEVKVYRCALDSNQITEIFTTALPKVVGNKEVLKVYPNPSSEDVRFEFANQNQTKYILHIYNAQGQLVRTIEGLADNSIVLKKEDLSSGLYFYQLIKGKGIVSRGEFVLK